MGEIDAIQETVDYIIYNLWGMKEPNYVMRVMETGGRPLLDETCKETVRRWKENGEDLVNNFNYKLPFNSLFFTVMRLMITKTSGMHHHQLKIHG